MNSADDIGVPDDGNAADDVWHMDAGDVNPVHGADDVADVNTGHVGQANAGGVTYLDDADNVTGMSAGHAQQQANVAHIKTVNGYDAKVNVGQQNKHIPGTNEYKNAWNNGQIKSIMYGDVNDIQNLLNNKAGTGDFFGINKERVDFGQVIGQYVDPDTGIGVETTIGIIHYGRNGAHIVPARPN